MQQYAPSSPLCVNTIFISDIHLGFKGCQADALLNFLESVDARKVYLVGDIIDIWQMKKSIHWPPSHIKILEKLVRMSIDGVEIIYIPGNHDEVLRQYTGLSIGNISLRQKDVHVTAQGIRLLVLHGDAFDSVIQSNKAIGLIGSHLYDRIIDLNHYFNAARSKFGFNHWSLATFLKNKMENAIHYIANFRRALTYEAQRNGLDGVVCGHIHHPEITEEEGILYCNDGDWVENSTALIEHLDGQLKLITWRQGTLYNETGLPQDKKVSHA